MPSPRARERPLSPEDARRGLVVGPGARAALRQGAEAMAAVLAPTLGPLARSVVVQPVDASKPPEVLSDAATIARRTTELPNRYVNAGAMLMRHLVWNMRSQVGDGSATAAVLSRAMIEGACRMEAAGHHPVLLRRGIEMGVYAAVAQLRSMARPLGPREIAAVLSESASGEKALARTLAEAFEMVGMQGVIVVEESNRASLELEYTQGIHWDGGLASWDFCLDPARHETVVIDPVIALADAVLTRAEQVTPILRAAKSCGAATLAIIAESFKGEALGTLLLNWRAKDLTVAPIRTPGLSLSRPEILRDLAVLTGAIVVETPAGMRLEDYRVENLGSARRVIATPQQFTILGGKGRQRDIHRRMAQVRAEMDAPGEMPLPDMLRKRLANLSGGSAILRVGAFATAELRAKTRIAEDAIRAVKAAAEEGVVPGGGVAYVACMPAVERAAQDVEDEDIRAGINVVAEALAAPLRQIAENAGHTGSTIVHAVKLRKGRCGFDAITGQILDESEREGLLDPVKVLCVALEKAASIAVMLLSSEGVVLRDRQWGKATTFKP